MIIRKLSLFGVAMSFACAVFGQPDDFYETLNRATV